MTARRSRTRTAARPWLLLIHQVPPKPDYLRVKIGRRLQRVGAIAVKNSVYVLPAGPRSQEDFQWIRREITDAGGDASICEAGFVDGLTDTQLQRAFQAARGTEYREVAVAARELEVSLRASGKGAGRGPPRLSPDDELARLRQRLSVIRALDFFDAPEQAPASEALTRVEVLLNARDAVKATVPAAVTIKANEFRGRTWVTRRDIFVDRIASAWLIRRYIDPKARFKFVAEDGFTPAKGDVRFDMFEGEFTHVGDRCTFETLVERFRLRDDGLEAIAQVVHDIDLKDGKFAREDSAGIERVLAALVAASPDDQARLERGCQLFDELRRSFATAKGGTPARPARKTTRTGRSRTTDA